MRDVTVRAALLASLLGVSECHWLFPYEAARDDARPVVDAAREDAGDGAADASLVPPMPATISILAGTPGVPGLADNPVPLFNWPEDLALDWVGKAIYVADRYNDRIRQVDLAAVTVKTLWAGSSSPATCAVGAPCTDGTTCCSGYCAFSACEGGAHGIALKRDPGGLTVYLATWAKGILRLRDSTQTWIRPDVSWGWLLGIVQRASASKDEDELFVTEWAGPTWQFTESRIRRLLAPAGAQPVEVYSGGADGFEEGDLAAAQFRSPYGMVFSPDQRFLYVADRNNHRVRRIDTASGQVSTLAGTGVMGEHDDLRADQATFCYPEGLALDQWGYLYVTEVGAGGVSGSNNCSDGVQNQCGDRLRRISPTGIVTTIAKGRGVPGPDEKQLPLTAAKLCEPTGIAVAPDGRIFVADTGNHIVRVLE